MVGLRIRKFKVILKAIKLISITLLLSACARPTVQAPISSHRQPPSNKITSHTVAPGETLYSIAWRYNLDYKELARINGIERNYTIYPGQTINFKRTSRKPKIGAVKPKTKPKTNLPASTLTNPPVKTHTEVVTPKPAERLIKRTPVVKKPPLVVPKAGPVKWRWPIRGRVLTKFGGQSSLNKGVDIAGRMGESVYAAAAGTIVYSGDGLRGYGKLVIIKHNDKYLSAYAHNSKVLVKEGAIVKRGEVIAKVGASGSDSARLHFEIRYDGKPVDPLKYLPKN
ncbi:MAG: lipoprotein NlpD [Flavobacteriales bacterium]